MGTLQDILYKVNIRSVAGPTDIAVKDLQINSGKVTEGSVFIAIRGSNTDGHQFIPAAISNKAVAIICESIPDQPVEGVTYVEVENTSVAIGSMAHNYYGQPSEKLKLVGVTGTNGKTTVATLLFTLFSQLGHHSGLISTVQNQIGDKALPSTHTTPDAITLNALLRQMVDEGCTHAFMETSSHAIHQHRIGALQYAGGIFTNITHDHLDYHKTFDEYIRVKKMFFDSLSSQAFALSNADDRRGAVMLQNTAASKYFYSLKTMADFRGRILENTLTGLVMMINDQEVHFRMIGEFNAYNLLAVFGTAVCLGEDKQQALKFLSGMTGAEGRFDHFRSAKENIIGIIDYAHTPDALINVLTTIQKLRKGSGQVITVVGCGGDRDRAKRPLMGAAACEYSNRAIFTSDNPRSEDPEAIIRDMETGLNAAAKRKYLVITDRKEAIKTAVTLAGKDDIVLIAGKGHEKYQEIKGVKHPFDDKAILKETFGMLDK